MLCVTHLAAHAIILDSMRHTLSYRLWGIMQVYWCPMLPPKMYATINATCSDSDVGESGQTECHVCVRTVCSFCVCVQTLEWRWLSRCIERYTKHVTMTWGAFKLKATTSKLRNTIANVVIGEGARTCTKCSNHTQEFEVVVALTGQLSQSVTIREVQRSLGVLESLLERK